MLVGPELAIMVPGGSFSVLVGPKLAIMGPGGSFLVLSGSKLAILVPGGAAAKELPAVIEAGP